MLGRVCVRVGVLGRVHVPVRVCVRVGVLGLARACACACVHQVTEWRWFACVWAFACVCEYMCTDGVCVRTRVCMCM